MALHCTLLLPILKVPQNLDACRVLHPLDNLKRSRFRLSQYLSGLKIIYLKLGDKVGVGVGQEDVIHPLFEDIEETLVDLEPACRE